MLPQLPPKGDIFIESERGHSQRVTTYSFLALFNPRVRVTLSPGTVSLGQRVYVQWEFSGRTQVLRSLRMWLEGREEATYRRGTSTYTDKSIFAALPVVETTHAAEIASGSAGVTIPADLMHSFSGDNNKIVWALRVEGEIERWPDVSEEFPVTVLPAPVERMRA